MKTYWSKRQKVCLEGSENGTNIWEWARHKVCWASGWGKLRTRSSKKGLSCLCHVCSSTKSVRVSVGLKLSVDFPDMLCSSTRWAKQTSPAWSEHETLSCPWHSEPQMQANHLLTGKQHGVVYRKVWFYDFILAFATAFCFGCKSDHSTITFTVLFQATNWWCLLSLI